MITLISYSGIVFSEQKGANYEFPAYSTVLGAVLAAYHSYVKSGSERIDSYGLAADLGIKIAVGYNPQRSKLGFRYVQHHNVTSSAIPHSPKYKLEGAEITPRSLPFMMGQYTIVVETENKDVIEALKKRPIRIGARSAIASSYKIDFFASSSDFEEFIGSDKAEEKYAISRCVWLKNRINRSEAPSVTARIESHDGHFERTGLSCSAAFHDGQEITMCLVSQIKKSESHNYIDGLYCYFELLPNSASQSCQPLAIMVDYSRLKEAADEALSAMVA